MISSPLALKHSQARSKLALDFAVAALRAGDLNEAQRLLRQRVFEDPADVNALSKLADVMLELGRIEEATILLRRAAQADSSPGRRMALIRHLKRHAGSAAALREIESLPADIRSHLEVLSAKAAALGDIGDHDQQIAIYEQMVECDPRRPGLWKALGDALKTVGRTEEAVAALRRAIETNPNYGEAWWTLSNFKSFRFTDEDISRMQKALRGRLSDEDALHFHFALGQALEDRKEFAKSFQHYKSGNDLRGKGLNPAAQRVSSHVDRAIATHTAEQFELRTDAGCPEQGPIFVLGLNRSGSTLVEQILGSHPLIEATTEITVMNLIWKRIARTAAGAGHEPFQEMFALSSSELKLIGEEYLQRTRAYRFTDMPFFVDKLPANWMVIGLIRLILPKAKIVDARRHPMACGFSNFKQNYASGMTFSYSLESIGAFYRDYWRLLRHIELVQPGIVHRIINERLIDDPEGEVRRLLEFVGVPFDAACLEFHKTKRAIRTPSAEQVRKGISREGVDQWRNYEPWLGPLKEALGEALDNWDKPAA